MCCCFWYQEQAKLSAYRDRRFSGTQEEFEEALRTSSTVYIGNVSFYTTEEQIYELFSRAGEIKKIIMGLDKNTKTPCGFCFVLWVFHHNLLHWKFSYPDGVVVIRFYSREDTEDAVKYISGTILDDRPIRVDFDWGFQEGRQWGRGRSGGQVFILSLIFWPFVFVLIWFSEFHHRFEMNTVQIMILISFSVAILVLIYIDCHI